MNYDDIKRCLLDAVNAERPPVAPDDDEPSVYDSKVADPDPAEHKCGCEESERLRAQLEALYDKPDIEPRMRRGIEIAIKALRNWSDAPHVALLLSSLIERAPTGAERASARRWPIPHDEALRDALEKAGCHA